MTTEEKKKPKLKASAEGGQINVKMDRDYPAGNGLGLPVPGKGVGDRIARSVPGSEYGQFMGEEISSAYKKAGGGARGFGAGAATAVKTAVGAPLAVADDILKPLYPANRAVGEGMASFGQTMLGEDPSLAREPVPPARPAAAPVAAAPAAGAPAVEPPASVGQAARAALSSGPGTGGIRDQSGREVRFDGNQITMNRPFEGEPWLERRARQAVTGQREGIPRIEMGDVSNTAEHRRQIAERNRGPQFASPTHIGGNDRRGVTVGDLVNQRFRARESQISATNLAGQTAASSAAEQARSNRARQGLDQERLGLDREKAAVEAANVGSQITERGANIQEKQLGIQERQRLASLQEQYISLNDSNDPGGSLRKRITRQMQDLSGKSAPKHQLVTQKSVDPTTLLPIESHFVFDDDGYADPLTARIRGGNDPASDYISKILGK